MSFLAGFAEGGLESLRRRKLEEATEAERLAEKLAAEKLAQAKIDAASLQFARDKSLKELEIDNEQRAKARESFDKVVKLAAETDTPISAVIPSGSFLGGKFSLPNSSVLSSATGKLEKIKTEQTAKAQQRSQTLGRVESNLLNRAGNLKINVKKFISKDGVVNEKGLANAIALKEKSVSTQEIFKDFSEKFPQLISKVQQKLENINKTPENISKEDLFNILGEVSAKEENIKTSLTLTENKIDSINNGNRATITNKKLYQFPTFKTYVKSQQITGELKDVKAVNFVGGYIRNLDKFYKNVKEELKKSEITSLGNIQQNIIIPLMNDLNQTLFTNEIKTVDKKRLEILAPNLTTIQEVRDTFNLKNDSQNIKPFTEITDEENVTHSQVKQIKNNKVPLDAKIQSVKNIENFNGQWKNFNLDGTIKQHSNGGRGTVGSRFAIETLNPEDKDHVKYKPFLKSLWGLSQNPGNTALIETVAKQWYRNEDLSDSIRGEIPDLITTSAELFVGRIPKEKKVVDQSPDGVFKRERTEKREIGKVKTKTEGEISEDATKLSKVFASTEITVADMRINLAVAGSLEYVKTLNITDEDEFDKFLISILNSKQVMNDSANRERYNKIIERIKEDKSTVKKAYQEIYTLSKDSDQLRNRLEILGLPSTAPLASGVTGFFDFFRVNIAGGIQSFKNNINRFQNRLNSPSVNDIEAEQANAMFNKRDNRATLNKQIDILKEMQSKIEQTDQNDFATVAYLRAQAQNQFNKIQLAYQFASIAQGGVGGSRTISDADFENNFNALFSSKGEGLLGVLDTIEQRIAIQQTVNSLAVKFNGTGVMQEILDNATKLGKEIFVLQKEDKEFRDTSNLQALERQVKSRIPSAEESAANQNITNNQKPVIFFTEGINSGFTYNHVNADAEQQLRNNLPSSIDKAVTTLSSNLRAYNYNFSKIMEEYENDKTNPAKKQSYDELDDFITNYFLNEENGVFVKQNVFGRLKNQDKNSNDPNTDNLQTIALKYGESQTDTDTKETMTLYDYVLEKQKNTKKEDRVDFEGNKLSAMDFRNLEFLQNVMGIFTQKLATFPN